MKQRYTQARARACAALVGAALSALVVTAGTSAHVGRKPSAPANAQAARAASALSALSAKRPAGAQSVVVGPAVGWQQTYGPSPDPTVKAMTYAPDGQILLTAHGDRAANLWRAADGALLHTFTNPGYSCSGGATGAAYAPDGQLIAVADACATRLIAVADGTTVRRLIGAEGRVAFSPDGRYLASTMQTAYRNRNVRLWRVTDGSLVWSITGGGGEVAFAPDGALATIGHDGIEFWNLADGARLRTITGPSAALAFSPDGQFVAGAGGAVGEYPYDSTLAWYRTSDGSLVRQLTRTGQVWTLRFTPDSQYLVGGGADAEFNRTSGYATSVNALRVWRLSDGLAFKTYDLGTDYPGFAGLAVAPDQQTLAYAVGATTFAAHFPAPTQCTYTITPTSATFAREGGTGTIAVDTQPGCPWTARARTDWLAVTAGQSGAGPGTVTYTVAPDTDPVAPGNPYFIHDVLVVAEQTFAVHQDIAPPGPGHFRIYGQVTDGFCGTGIEGVTVSLSGAAAATALTDSSGQFSFDNLLANQSYTVTPAKDGYTFSPASRTVDNLSADYGLTFTTTFNPHPLPSLRGRVTDAGGHGLNGVQLQLNGGAYPRSEYTNTFGSTDGSYAFNCVEPGHTYTLAPSSPDYNFTPASRTFDNLTAPQTGDFVAASNMIGRVIISEFRLRGPAGGADEFVELYNATDQPLTVNATDGSAGWSLATPDQGGSVPALVAVIPNGTTIPARGHYLVANGSSAGGYSLPVAADQTFAADIADNNGVALFLTAQPAHMTNAYWLDAAGFAGTGGAPLFAEGAGVAPVASNVGADEQYSYLRRMTTGVPQNTGDNAQDFVLVSTTGTVAGTQAQLGAPSPENSRSPVQRNAQLKASLVDRLSASTAAPNRVRDLNPVTNGALGTLTIRRRFTNKTGQPVSALRFRVIDITTLGTPSPGGAQADLRVLSSPDAQVMTSSGALLVRGTLVEQPPTQAAGGGLNSALVVALPNGALASGASVDVQFVLGVQQGGSFRFLINVEATTGSPPTPTVQKHTSASK